MYSATNFQQRATCNIGLIGLGRVGKNILKCLLADPSLNLPKRRIFLSSRSCLASDPMYQGFGFAGFDNEYVSKKCHVLIVACPVTQLTSVAQDARLGPFQRSSTRLLLIVNAGLTIRRARSLFGDNFPIIVSSPLINQIQPPLRRQTFISPLDDFGFFCAKGISNIQSLKSALEKPPCSKQPQEWPSVAVDMLCEPEVLAQLQLAVLDALNASVFPVVLHVLSQCFLSPEFIVGTLNPSEALSHLLLRLLSDPSASPPTLRATNINDQVEEERQANVSHLESTVIKDGAVDLKKNDSNNVPRIGNFLKELSLSSNRPITNSEHISTKLNPLALQALNNPGLLFMELLNTRSKIPPSDLHLLCELERLCESHQFHSYPCLTGCPLCNGNPSLKLPFFDGAEFVKATCQPPLNQSPPCNDQFHNSCSSSDIFTPSPFSVPHLDILNESSNTNSSTPQPLNEDETARSSNIVKSSPSSSSEEKNNADVNVINAIGIQVRFAGTLANQNLKQIFNIPRFDPTPTIVPVVDRNSLEIELEREKSEHPLKPLIKALEGPDGSGLFLPLLSKGIVQAKAVENFDDSDLNDKQKNGNSDDKKENEAAVIRMSRKANADDLWFTICLQSEEGESYTSNIGFTKLETRARQMMLRFLLARGFGSLSPFDRDGWHDVISSVMQNSFFI